MKNILVCIVSAVFLLISLTGCGSKSNNDPDTHLIISKDGSVTSVIIESFAQSYYDIDELKASIDKEVNDYNLLKNGAITVNDITYENAIVNVRMTYKGSDDYTAFNRELLFCGSPLEALSKGMSLNVILTDVNDSTKTISEADIKNMVKEKILITEFEGTIYLPSKIIYASDNATVFADGKSVKTNGSKDAPIYIIYK